MLVTPLGKSSLSHLMRLHCNRAAAVAEGDGHSVIHPPSCKPSALLAACPDAGTFFSLDRLGFRSTTYIAAKMSEKRQRDATDATEDGRKNNKKQNRGFTVGPQNLPDGTYRRKSMLIYYLDTPNVN
jgi:hypothetical protein